MDARPCKCGEWDAVEDRWPLGPATLTVKGALICPTPGYKVELVRAEPQGIVPDDLILDLKITGPKGPVAQVISQAGFLFEETVDAGRFRTVTIRGDCGTRTVQVVQ